MVSQVAEALSDMCLMRLLSDDGQLLKLASIYSHDSEFSQALRKISLSISERADDPGMAQYVFRTGKPAFVPVITVEQTLNSLPPEYEGIDLRFAPHSYIVVPLRVQGRSIGVLALTRYRTEQPAFSEDDVTLAQDLADRAALAINSARQFEQAQKELDERKHAEDRLRESEHLFSEVFTNSPVAISLVSAADGKNIKVNDAWCILTGFSKEEAIGYDSGELKIFSQEERDRLIKEFSTKGYSKHIDSEITTKGGGKKNIIMSSELISIKENRFILVSVIDITERKRAEKQIVQMKRLYATLSQVNQTIVRVKDRADLYQSICDVAAKFGEFSLAWVGLLDEGSGDVRPVAAVGQDVSHWPFATINIRKGKSKDGLISEAIRNSKVVTSEDLGSDERIKSQAELIQKYDYHSTAVVPFRLRGKTIGAMTLISGTPGFFNSEDEIRLLDEMGLDISFALDTMETESERKRAEQSLINSESALKKAQRVAHVGSWVWHTTNNRLEWSDEMYHIFGIKKESFTGLLSDAINRAIHPDDRAAIEAANRSVTQEQSPKPLEYRVVWSDGTVRTVWAEAGELVLNDKGQVEILTGIVQDITERKQAENSIRLAEQQYRLLFEEAPVMVVLTELNNTDVLIAKCNQKFLSTLGYDQDEVIGKSLAGFYSADSRAKLEQSYFQTMKGILLSEERELITRDGRIITVLLRAVPRANAEGTVIGTQASYIDITERKLAEKKVQVQLQRLSALSEIDHAINSSMDMRLSLDILLTQVLSQLNVDAASVLLLNPASQTLEYVVGKGFRTTAIRKSSLRLGVGFAGQVGLERKVLHIKDLYAIGTQFQRRDLLKEDYFLEYFGVPLVAKGMLKGVLEVFHRSPLDVDSDWINYLETLGGQAAIAIDNVQLFDDIQKSNLELITAYDATIAGWSQAMDLRDKETEGHTLRVTELTVQLAIKLGIGQQEIVQMRRGALLHDIGKLGIPDNILLKPDKLTDFEWAIMRQHPRFAYNMLLPIIYLRPALDIPYCHHEKWDGTGYPRGLREEQIPLSARIFAIVDVWDALRSDRPYRASWSVEKTREHIIEGSGTHFDPQVVEAFLSLLDEFPDLH